MWELRFSGYFLSATLANCLKWRLSRLFNLAALLSWMSFLLAALSSFAQALRKSVVASSVELFVLRQFFIAVRMDDRWLVCCFRVRSFCRIRLVACAELAIISRVFN